MKTQTLTLFSAAAVLAAGMTVSNATAQGTGLPPEQRVGDVSFVTGGVGDDQATAFKQASAGYPLTIEIVRSQSGRNEYTSGAQIQLAKRSGAVVLSTKAEGPFVLVRVPPGDYQVQATLSGRTLSKDVSVGANGSARATIAFAGD